MHSAESSKWNGNLDLWTGLMLALGTFPFPCVSLLHASLHCTRRAVIWLLPRFSRFCLLFSRGLAAPLSEVVVGAWHTASRLIKFHQYGPVPVLPSARSWRSTASPLISGFPFDSVMMHCRRSTWKPLPVCQSESEVFWHTRNSWVRYSLLWVLPLLYQEPAHARTCALQTYWTPFLRVLRFVGNVMLFEQTQKHTFFWTSHSRGCSGTRQSPRPHHRLHPKWGVLQRKIPAEPRLPIARHVS